MCRPEQVWIDQDVAASPISTSQGCACSESPGSVRRSRSCHRSSIPSPSSACPLEPCSALRAVVEDVGCIDALVSLASDLHPPAITFSLAPNTAVAARERIWQGVNKEPEGGGNSNHLLLCVLSSTPTVLPPPCLTHGLRFSLQTLSPGMDFL